MYLLYPILSQLNEFGNFLTSHISSTPWNAFSEMTMILSGIFFSLLFSIPIIKKVKFSYPIFFVDMLAGIFVAAIFLRLEYSNYIGLSVLGFISFDHACQYNKEKDNIRIIRFIELIISIVGMVIGFSYISKMMGWDYTALRCLLFMFISYKVFYYIIHICIACIWNFKTQYASLFPTNSEFGRIYMENTFRNLTKFLYRISGYSRSISTRYDLLFASYQSGLESVLKEIFPQGNINSLDLLSKKEILDYKDRIEQREADFKEQKRKEKVNIDFDILTHKYLKGVEAFLCQNYSKNSHLEVSFNTKEIILGNHIEEIERLDRTLILEIQEKELIREIKQIASIYPLGIGYYLKSKYNQIGINGLNIHEKENIIKDHETIQTFHQKLKEEYKTIKTEYPIGFNLHLEKHLKYLNTILGFSPENRKVPKIYNIEFMLLTIEKKEEIIKLHSYFSVFESTKKSYNDFDISFESNTNEILKDWERKEYIIGKIDPPISDYQLEPLGVRIIQYQLVKSQTQNLSSYISEIVGSVAMIINKMGKAIPNTLGVVFTDYNNETQFFFDRLYNYSDFLTSIDTSKDIVEYCIYSEGKIKDIRTGMIKTFDYYLLISFSLSGNQLLNLSKENNFLEKKSKVASISVCHELPEIEVKNVLVITKGLLEEKDRKRKEEEERKKQIEEIARKEEDKEKIRRKELEKQQLEEQKRQELIRIKNKVSSYETLSSSRGAPIKHFYFHDYYPTTENVVSEFDWNVRRLIWDFKDGKLVSTEEVSDMVSNKLKQTFTSQELTSMTLICAPASTIQKNNTRFRSFARKVCSNTGMSNGFEKITIHTEREGTHLTGVSINPINYLSFDSDFFQDKRVIIFDDVVTRGRTMCILNRHLESLGASVIFAVSIGKTKHR